MMDSSDIRPHRTTTTTAAATTTPTPSLFICFTSRLSSASSSSSMKISSKSSILSPGRARDTPTSLSTSVSRRLKANGSLKGAQSPMFPTGGKRRGFENPEPSSPKVTCIGQVRVKTKKQGNKIRTLSRRRSGDFRRVTVRDNTNFGLNSGVNQQQQQQENMPIHQRNQRWVHLPLTICEALRKGFGAEFSCLFPCRAPSCLKGGGGKEERERGRRKESGGEAVFAGRWLVAVNEGGGEVGIGREVELVVGGEEVEERREIRERISLRRHADDEDEEDEEEEVGFEEDEKCKGGGRLSICVPPKNALLLMRSRSDPVRVSALASRFWESPSADKCAEEAEEDDEIVEKCDESLINGVLGLVEVKADEGYEELGLVEVSNEEEEEEEEKPEAEVGLMEVEEREGNPEERKLEIDVELCQEADEEENQELFVEEENGLNKSLPEAVADPEKLELTEDVLLIQQGDKEDAQGRESHSSSIVSVHLFSDDEFEEELAAALEKGEEESEEVIETQNSPWKVEGEGEEKAIDQEKFESDKTLEEEEAIMESEEEREEKQRESDISPLLPDCLLLMRCEPKLSMEVSKETWVCTTDFIRWLPERPPKPTDGGGGDELKKKKRVSTGTESNTVHYQPPRSSCSLPAAVAGRVSTAARIEQRLVNAVAYEPLGLTRCKSEPMRTAAAKLKPESCFWKNRKLEPHSRATVGVGAVGF